LGLYNFQPHFVPFILDGRKTHTIRAERVHPDKPGNTLHLYTGLRTKKATLLMRAPCVRVERIVITLLMPTEAIVFIEDHELDKSESEALARRDGFYNLAEMAGFWHDRLPFVGNIIHWRYAR
jgi:hypothetical protein